MADIVAQERAEVDQRARRFRGDRGPLPVAARTTIVARRDRRRLHRPRPARSRGNEGRPRGAGRARGPQSAIAEMAAGGDVGEVVCLEARRAFQAVGQFYADFSQTSDGDVVELLGRAAERPTTKRDPPAGGGNSAPGTPQRSRPTVR